MVLQWHSMINRFVWKKRFTPQISWTNNFKRGTWSIPKSLKSYLKITFMRNGSLSLVSSSISRCFIVQYESEMLLSMQKTKAISVGAQSISITGQPWGLAPEISHRNSWQLVDAGSCGCVNSEDHGFNNFNRRAPNFGGFFGPSSDAGCTLERGYEWPAGPVRRRIHWDTFSLLLWQQSTALS